MKLSKNGKPRTAWRLKAEDPTLPEFWNVQELTRHAARLGWIVSSARIGHMISTGQGPKISAVSGPIPLIKPEDGKAWLEEQIAIRRDPQLRHHSMKRIVDEPVALQA